MSLLTVFLICISSFSFSFIYINTSFVYIIRSIGALGKFNAKSFNLNQALLIFNSFFVAISLTSIAYLIDTIPNLKLIFVIFITSLLIIIIFHILIILKFEHVIRFINFLLKKYYKQMSVRHSENILLPKSFSFNLIVSSAWLSYLIGFIFPSLMAVIFNDYRTTLFQLSFIFNSLGTFLTILIIEKKLSVMADEKMTQLQKSKIMSYLSNILFNRVIASSFLLLLLIFFYFYLSL